MAGQVFGMCGDARGCTVMRASPPGPVVREFPGPAERGHQSNVGEQAQFDSALVAR